MRPYSYYLEHLKNEDPNVKYHLGGSTPPLLFSFKKYQNWIAKKSLDNSLEDKVKKLIAKKANCDISQIELTPASTQACFQILAAITQPGDAILIEYPTYEPYLAAAKFLQLKVERYNRTDNFNSDWTEISHKAKKAKVLLISNPHCPTGWLYSADAIKKISELKLTVIVDEVFLPLWTNGKITQVDLRKTNMISISSISKSTGFSFARFGWIISSNPIAEVAIKVGLHLHSDFPKPILPYGYLALKNWKLIHQELTSRAEQNRNELRQFLKRNPGIASSHDFKNGYFGVIKIPKSMLSAKKFVQTLLKKEVLVRDAGFFEMPDWIRLHILLENKKFKKALSIIESFY